jgi:hypothetical protein
MKVGVLESRTSNNLEVYKRFETIYDLGSKEATYFLTVNKDGYYKVEFGDDRLSKKLSLGNVVVIQSLVTDGDIGNNAVDVSCISSVAGFYAVEVFPYQKYSFGGSDEESIDSVRRAAVLSFSSQGSAVSDSDYVAITKEIFPEAGSVVSWGGEYNDPPMFGYQMVSVIPRNSDILNDVQKQYLVEGLRKRNVDNDKDGFSKSKSDGSIDLESRLTNYVSQQRYKAIQELAEELDLSDEQRAELFKEMKKES